MSNIELEKQTETIPQTTDSVVGSSVVEIPVSPLPPRKDDEIKTQQEERLREDIIEKRRLFEVALEDLINKKYLIIKKVFVLHQLAALVNFFIAQIILHLTFVLVMETLMLWEYSVFLMFQTLLFFIQ